MGDMGRFECERGCDYLGAELTLGAGFDSEYELRRCSQCGDLQSVLKLRREPDGRLVSASGRGRCPSCRSQSLRPVPEAEERVDNGEASGLECPECCGPLTWHSTAIWD